MQVLQAMLFKQFIHRAAIHAKFGGQIGGPALRLQGLAAQHLGCALRRARPRRRPPALVDQPSDACGFQLGPELIQIGPGKPEGLGDVLGGVAGAVQPIGLEFT